MAFWFITQSWLSLRSQSFLNDSEHRTNQMRVFSSQSFFPLTPNIFSYEPLMSQKNCSRGAGGSGHSGHHHLQFLCDYNAHSEASCSWWCLHTVSPTGFGVQLSLPKRVSQPYWALPNAPKGSSPMCEQTWWGHCNCSTLFSGQTHLTPVCSLR